MFNKIKEYINDNEFRVTIFKDRVYIVNYLQILGLEEERISLLIPDGRLIIKGLNLHLNKLLDNELLISGKVLLVEVESNE